MMAFAVVSVAFFSALVNSSERMRRCSERRKRPSLSISPNRTDLVPASERTTERVREYRPVFPPWCNVRGSRGTPNLENVLWRIENERFSARISMLIVALFDRDSTSSNRLSEAKRVARESNGNVEANRFAVRKRMAWLMMILLSYPIIRYDGK